MNDDLISRQAALDAIGEKADEIYKTKQKGATYPHNDFFQGMAYAEAVVKQLPSAQPEWTTDVNDILAYLDGVVHPLVSPENWNVYSELYDMVSGLLKPWEGEPNE